MVKEFVAKYLSFSFKSSNTCIFACMSYNVICHTYQIKFISFHNIKKKYVSNLLHLSNDYVIRVEFV